MKTYSEAKKEIAEFMEKVRKAKGFRKNQICKRQVVDTVDKNIVVNAQYTM